MPSEVTPPRHIFIVASAGSGKTTYLIDEALKIKDKKVLITTYTEANDHEIRQKFIQKNGCVPKNITIQTWFSMLLQHGVRPFQGYAIENDITGMILVQGQSARGTRETDQRHYFSKELKIYSDKLCKFVLKCNNSSGGKVISRLARIYGHIFIDEVQDLAGYDLEFIKLLCTSTVNIVLVGDPRQGTFSTNNSRKNQKYRRSEILNYFNDNEIEGLEIQDALLTRNHRCVQSICVLADSLFPNFPQATSGNTTGTSDTGVFLVKTEDVENYILNYPVTILRDSKRTTVSQSAQVMNFGASKGLTFDRVLIYPTGPITKWLNNRTSELADASRAKLYVAITRAKYSIAFVYDYKGDEVISGCEKFAITP
jgi:DNA helicase-2/ATP-dependent DNA helicase PcrA